MKIWFDTEFIEDGKTIDLMSIGLVREDGAVWYGEVAECDLSKAGEWVQKNVIPHLKGGVYVLPREGIRQNLLAFAGNAPQFWTFFGAYDWVALAQLFGRMIDLPPHWPMHHMDIQQVRIERGIGELPKQTGTAHNALDDAIWTRDVHHWMLQQPVKS